MVSADGASSLRHATGQPSSRTELVLIVLVLIIGVGLRAAYPSRMAVEHFDEGIYASTFWFLDDALHYPASQYFAPPLLPALAKLSIRLLGPGAYGCMLVNIVAGSLTVAVVWWAARNWFGPAAGLAGAVMAAFSDFHIFYSRTVLTDVLLSLWCLLAVYLVWAAFRTLKFAAVMAAGVVTGLAWWTKYNGWLPLAIALAGLLPWLVQERVGWRHAARLLACWMGMAVTAFVVWSPVLLMLPQPGGYAAVQANHRRYLVGLAGWFDSFLHQAANHRHLDGWLSCASVGLAFVLAGIGFTWKLKTDEQPDASTDRAAEILATDRRRDGSVMCWLPLASVGLFLVGCAALLGTSYVLCSLAVVGIGIRLFPNRRCGSRSPHERLAAWLLAAWFVGLLVATPFYRAYPRLSLPWLVAAWLGTASAMQWAVGWLAVRSADTAPAAATNRRLRSVWPTVALTVAAVALIFSSAGRVSSKGVPGWQDRTGLKTIADEVIADAGQAARGRPHDETVKVPFVIYVYAQPALVFHLTSQGIVAYPANDLEFVHPGPDEPRVPTFLVMGDDTPGRQQRPDNWPQYRDDFELVRAYPYRPSDLVWMDAVTPQLLSDAASRPQTAIRLYRVK